MAASCCRKLVQSDSDQADTLALKEGLQFAKDMIFLNLVVESYSLNTIKEHQRTKIF